MIVSLSLIQCDTGLRLQCQQIATHCNSLMLRLDCDRVAYECDRCTALDVSQTASHSRYVLVALRLTGLIRLIETQLSYYNHTVNGGNATALRRYHGQTKLCHFLG